MLVLRRVLLWGVPGVPLRGVATFGDVGVRGQGLEARLELGLPSRDGKRDKARSSRVVPGMCGKVEAWSHTVFFVWVLDHADAVSLSGQAGP